MELKEPLPPPLSAHTPCYPPRKVKFGGLIITIIVVILIVLYLARVSRLCIKRSTKMYT